MRSLNLQFCNHLASRNLQVLFVMNKAYLKLIYIKKKHKKNSSGVRSQKRFVNNAE